MSSNRCNRVKQNEQSNARLALYANILDPYEVLNIQEEEEEPSPPVSPTTSSYHRTINDNSTNIDQFGCDNSTKPRINSTYSTERNNDIDLNSYPSIIKPCTLKQPNILKECNSYKKQAFHGNIVAFFCHQQVDNNETVKRCVIEAMSEIGCDILVIYQHSYLDLSVFREFCKDFAKSFKTANHAFLFVRQETDLHGNKIKNIIKDEIVDKFEKANRDRTDSEALLTLILDYTERINLDYELDISNEDKPKWKSECLVSQISNKFSFSRDVYKSNIRQFSAEPHTAYKSGTLTIRYSETIINGQYGRDVDVMKKCVNNDEFYSDDNQEINHNRSMPNERKRSIIGADAVAVIGASIALVRLFIEISHNLKIQSK